MHPNQTKPSAKSLIGMATRSQNNTSGNVEEVRHFVHLHGRNLLSILDEHAKVQREIKERHDAVKSKTNKAFLKFSWSYEVVMALERLERQLLWDARGPAVELLRFVVLSCV